MVLHLSFCVILQIIAFMVLSIVAAALMCPVAFSLAIIGAVIDDHNDDYYYDDDEREVRKTDMGHVGLCATGRKFLLTG